MKNNPLLIIQTLLFGFVFSLAACTIARPTAEQQPTTVELQASPSIMLYTPSSPPQITATLLPTVTTDFPLVDTPTPLSIPFEYPEAGQVLLDFVALACRARWVNGAFDLPCPGDRNNILEGYISPAYQAVAEGEIQVEAPLLIALPGSGGTHGAGLFGKYPPLLIRQGDTFHSTLACQDGTSCDVEFALEYYDAQGKYHHEMGWSWRHQFGGGPTPVQVDLSPLAGQEVQLTLVVRDQGTPEDDWVLWIYPYVANTHP